MIKQVLHILAAFALILILERCAQIVGLTGGKKDTQPPKLLEATPPEKNTGSTPEHIVLKFDEFVQIKDLSSQLIVSPRLKTPPEIRAEGKKIVIDLKKEELAPNTTYRLYFGKSIADLNESNSIEDFEYVFSTGDVIDTLKIQGSVSDAFSTKPSTDILLGLYFKKEATDSIVYKSEADYIARSGENGTFTFRNLPKRTFVIYGIDDKNKNKLYDGETEKVAFWGPDLKLTGDTTIPLKLFQEESSKSFIKKTNNPYYGFTQIILNRKVKVRVAPLYPSDKMNISETKAGIEKDTVAIYYKNINDSLSLVFSNLANGKTDTLKLTLPKNNQNKKRLKSFITNTQGGKLALNDKLRLTFLNWMDTSRSDRETSRSKIKLRSKEDSLIGNVPVNGHWRDIISYELDIKLKEGLDYSFKIDTGAFYDMNQFTNDSSVVNFKTQSKTDFGKLTLKLRLNTKQDYIIQLITEQGQVIKEDFISFSLSSSNAVSIDFIDILPGTYFARIIFDDNANKKWDTGNLIRKKQPERVHINSKQLKVLSDWEVEEEIMLKD
jgi:hypothetical protein